MFGREGDGPRLSRRGVLKGIGGTVAAATAGAGLSGASAAAGEPVALQYFHEDWTTITNDLDRVSDWGFDAVWIQQPAEAAVTKSEQNGRNDPPLGYQPINFRNFDSELGTESELRALIDTAHNNGVDVYLDTVLNHMAAESYDAFPYFSSWDFHEQGGIPGWAYQFDSTDDRCFENGSPKDPDRIECDPWWVHNGDLLGLKDLDQDKDYVRGELKKYMQDMRDLGADGYRFDAAKHIDESFFANYASQWADDWNMFRVGEVLSGSVDYVRDYVNAGPGMHAFDYPLYFVLTSVFDYGDMSNLQGAGLVARNSGRAMPFVENHDQAGPTQYKLAHAFVLTIEGYPVLYNLYTNWLLKQDDIKNMVWVKKNLAGGRTRWRYTGNDLAIYERETNLLVGINNSGSSRSQWVDTSWADTELNDYAGNAANVTTESDARVQITVPAESWVFYAPTGQGGDPDTESPTASFTYSPSTPEENQSVSFDATGSSDNVGIASYEWDFGDNATATGSTPTHTYTTDGQFSVQLTVTDDAGNSDSATQSITVESVDTTAPTADAGADRAVEEDTAITFDATGSSDNVGIVSYEWDFGDGATATGSTPTHTYADPGQYTVTLTVTDDAGNTASDTITVDVTDSGPAALPGASGPPTNVDSDDLLEDVDGDGDTDVFDVITYHNNRKSDAVRTNPEYFDFDGDGASGTVFDALKLYEDIS